MADIATANDLSAKRVQQMLEFAFLSPEVLASIAAGRQPPWLTTDWCLGHDIPAD